LDLDGNMFVSDHFNHKIRKISKAGYVSTLAGGEVGFEDGGGTTAKFNCPFGITLDTMGNIYVADSHNHCIRMITQQGVVSTVSGSGKPGFADGEGDKAMFKKPCGLVFDNYGLLYVADCGNNRIRKIL